MSELHGSHYLQGLHFLRRWRYPWDVFSAERTIAIRKGMSSTSYRWLSGVYKVKLYSFSI